MNERDEILAELAELDRQEQKNKDLKLRRNVSKRKMQKMTEKFCLKHNKRKKLKEEQVTQLKIHK